MATDLTAPAAAAPVAPERRRPRPERRVLAVVRWPVGGIRTHVLYTYPTLAAAGYRFTFVGPADATFAAFAAWAAALPGSEFVGVPVRGPDCRMAPAVRRLLRAGCFDLVHSHGLTAAAHAAVANFPRRAPHVVTVHDALRRDQFPGLRGRVKRAALGRLLRRADAAVPVTHDIRANLLEFLPAVGGGRCRLVVLPNGIDSERYAGPPPPEAAGLRARLGLEPGVPLVGFLGRFMEQKGFLVLLDAVDRLHRSPAPPRFHVVAVGSDDFEREYRAEVRRRGLETRVSMTPFVPDVRPTLCQLDLLVVPSLWEASSLLSMEAMAAGVPVLGTDCIGLREVLRDTPSRVARAADPESLAAELRHALDDPRTAEARAFAPAARARFDRRRPAGRLLTLFDELAAARRP